MAGPYNYIIAKCDDAQTALTLVAQINHLGMWEAVPLEDFSVVLPGQCVEGTEGYMRGFVDAFNLNYAPKAD